MNNFDNKDEFEIIQNSNEENVKAIIVSNDNDKKSKKTKNSNSKKMKYFTKSCFAVLCCASVGLGAGVGFNLSRNFIVNYEQSKFSFDNQNEMVSEESSADTLLLTSSDNLVSTIKEASNSVVNITTTSISNGFFNQTYRESGSGSGVIYKVEGDKVYIITNNHVVENTTTVTVSITGTEQILATLVGKDASSDLAIICASLQDFMDAGVSNVSPAKFGNSDEIEIGEYVFPIGNALGEGKTVTQGIISAQNKEIVIDGEKLTVLQTDAAINPGNSGGALINTKGEVIGINTAKLSNSAVEGIGYAIPTSIVTSIAENIILNGSIEKPYFGIMGFTITEDIKLTYNLKFNGVFITEVEDGSNAANSGVKVTDIITSFNGKTIETIEDLSQALSECNKGDTVQIGIIRNGFQEVVLSANLK